MNVSTLQGVELQAPDVPRIYQQFHMLHDLPKLRAILRSPEAWLWSRSSKSEMSNYPAVHELLGNFIRSSRLNEKTGSFGDVVMDVT